MQGNGRLTPAHPRTTRTSEILHGGRGCQRVRDELLVLFSRVDDSAIDTVVLGESE